MAPRLLLAVVMKSLLAATLTLGLFACGGEAFINNTTVDGADAKEIVGGFSTSITSVPWQVAILDTSNRQFCGGSILSPSWVLTAAHCQVAVGERVGAGVTRLSSIDVGQVTTVVESISFPGYEKPESGKDIALLRVEPPLSLSRITAKAIEFAAPAEGAAYLPNQAVTVSGWGALREGGGSPDILKKAEVDIWADSAVQAAYGTAPADQFGAARAGQDACQGDSGGPVAWAPRGRSPLLVGVVSWGEGCARPDKPGMYAKVSVFSGWVTEKTGLPPRQ
jgi:trypsin